MPLHGKIVVVKRTGGDGTEFPLTASCLFGRKADCDIRIQLPQVSKEHCRIDLNENKEVILTNLSSVNPTRVNGEALQQSERLKAGDVITIVDRSFRFEYPPAPTPKKFAKGSKVGTPNPHLKDGTNHIQRSLERAKGGDADVQQSKTDSPFSDLYQMIRNSLDVKTPRKSGTYIHTPRKSNVSTNQDTSKVVEATVSDGETVAEAKNTSNVTPVSDKKRKNSPQILASNVVSPGKDAENVKSEVSSPRSPQTRQRVTPQRFTASDVEKMCTPAPKSPMRRRSKEATPAKEHDNIMPSAQNTNSTEASGEGVPRKRKRAELVLDSPAPQMKKKRVSFGGYLVPELFDKKLPPDSPLRKGENPRRSLCLAKPKQSLLRRASVIGLSKHAGSYANNSSKSPKTSIKKSPKGRSPPSKEPSPEAKTPKPRTPSPLKKLSKSNKQKPNTLSAKASTAEKASKYRSFLLASSEKTSRTPSPKTSKSTPASPKWVSPGTKSPKPNSPSANTPQSGEKSPKARSPSPASSGKTSSRTVSPKSPKSTAASPAPLSAKKSPKSRSSSPASSEKTSSSSINLETPLPKGPTNKMSDSVKKAGRRLTPSKNVNEIPVKTPHGSQRKILSLQGRFAVSRIKTPSPIAEDAVIDPAQSVMVTPKSPLRRKSMKSTSRRTPLSKSAIQAIRRSGISRASIKAMSSWADTVKFGKAKFQMARPIMKIVKRTVTSTRVTKKMVSRTQTPLKKPLGHVSTGHAESPVTIVVGRAFKHKVTHPVAAVPKVIFNTVISKKNMNMDEDLSGISEMFKTPPKDGQRRSEINRTPKTPLVVNEPSVIDPSVLNTPEEPGEMAVSPLSLASTVKAGQYNKEAVKRLLNGSQESSFIHDTSAMETTTDSVEQQCTKMKASAVTTPKQKPKLPKCLTGVKRLLKTPREKAEPLEHLRGILLKTPKQKPEQQECLTGVKRIMKTPRQKTEPVEDLRGKLLKTPKQKFEQKECLTGVKLIFTTPKQSEAVDRQEKRLKTPREAEVAEVSFSGVVGHLDTPPKDSQDQPTPAEETQALPEQTNSSTLEVTSSPKDCFSGIKKTPKHRYSPVEGVLGIERLIKSPKERSEPVNDNFGIKQLMKSPRLRGCAPVEGFEGLQELMEEPTEFKDQPASSDSDVAKELDFTQGQPQDDGSSGVKHDTLQIDITKAETTVLVEVSSAACESSEAMEAVSQTVIEDAPGVTEMDTSSTDSANSKKLVRGRRVKAAERVTAESSQVAAVPAPVRVRRGKEVQPTEPPAEQLKAALKTKRGSCAKRIETIQGAATETLPEPEDEQSPPVNIEPAPSEKEAIKPKRKRYAKKALEQTGTVPQPSTETLPGPENETAVTDSVAPLERETVKPKRGRHAKKALKQTEIVPETATEILSEPVVTDSVAYFEEEALKPKRGRHAKKALKQTEILPEPATEILPEPVVTDSVAYFEEEAVKPKRGRPAKKALKQTEILPEPATEILPEPVVTDSVAYFEEEVVNPKRGRHAKKTLKQTEILPEPATEILPEPVVTDSVAYFEEEVVKPKRERHAKKALKQTEIVPETATEILPEPVVTDSVAYFEEEVVNPKRGRHAKKALKQTEILPEPATEILPEPVVTDSVAYFEEEVVKPKRGRHAKKALKQTEIVPEPATEMLPEPVVTDSVAYFEEEAVKPKRGRHAKKALKQTEIVPETATEMLPKPVVTDSVAYFEEEAVKQKRGRHAKKALKQTEIVPETATEILPEPVVTDNVAYFEEEAVKPKRGRHAKKALKQTEIVPEPATEMLPEPVVTDSVAYFEEEAVKPKRERHAKKALKQTETVPLPATEPLPEPESEPVVTDSVVSLEEEAVKPKRGRYAKNALKKTETVPQPATEILSEPESETAGTDNVSLLEDETVKPKRGRHAKKALEHFETVPQTSAKTLLEPESEPALTHCGAPLEEEAVKPTRGRKPKQSSRSKQAQSSRCSDVSQHDTAQDIKEVSDDHQEQIPTEHHENKSTDSTESLHEVEIAAEEDVPVVQKKSVRGRRGKLVEDEQGAALEEAVVSAPARPIRSKRNEATLTPAGRQTTRSRKTKTKAETSDALLEMVLEKDMEVNVMTGTSKTNTSQEDFKTPAEDSVVKPSQGRKTKLTPADLPEPEKTLGIEHQLPVPTNKRGRGRKVISETVEVEELEKVTSEETNCKSKPLARGTRGRNAKHEKELENSNKTSIVPQSGLQESIKASNPKKDDQTVDVENLVPVEAEGPPISEPEQISEHASGIAKTRRGVSRKPKQGAATPDFAENRDGPTATPTEKPQRSRRAKQDVTTSEVPVEKPEQKQQRGRGLKDDIKQVVPAKKARQGLAFACEEAKNVPVTVTEAAPTSVAPVKRGRRPLVKSSIDLSEVNKNQSNTTSDSTATLQEPQNPQRTVKWNLEVDVHEIPKRKVRAVRGKRSSPGDHTETQSQSESENAAKTEEDLSEKASEPQPTKRARRGAKVANETESTRKVDMNNAEDAETQPKNRRGRSAKK